MYVHFWFVISALVSATLWNAPAFAFKNTPVQLSPTFKVEISSKLETHMGFMPSLHGFWFEGLQGKQKFSIWMQRQVPVAPANEFSVKRYWQDGIAQSTANGEVTTDLGCKTEKNHLYVCRRNVKAEKARFASETFYWNGKEDMVVVRVMSSSSFAESKKIADLIQAHPGDRIPAGKVTK